MLVTENFILISPFPCIGEIFLSATDFWSQLLPFNGTIFLFNLNPNGLFFNE